MQAETILVHRLYRSGEELPPNDPPRLHQSIAAEMINRSPLHGWWKAFRKPGREEYEARTTLGQIAHSLLLGGKNIAIVEANDWRTNAAKEQRDAAIQDGRLPILKARMDDARTIVERVQAELVARGWDSGDDEITALWRTDSGVECEGRLDRFIKKEHLILDFKFCENAQKRVCESKFLQFGYDIQQAAYRQAVETIFPKLAGRMRMEFVFCEVEPPHAVRFMPISGQLRAYGETRWNKAVELWQQFLETPGADTPWPSYEDNNQPAEIPGWAWNALVAEMDQFNPEATTA